MMMSWIAIAVRCRPCLGAVLRRGGHSDLRGCRGVPLWRLPVAIAGLGWGLLPPPVSPAPVLAALIVAFAVPFCCRGVYLLRWSSADSLCAAAGSPVSGAERSPAERCRVVSEPVGSHRPHGGMLASRPVIMVGSDALRVSVLGRPRSTASRSAAEAGSRQSPARTSRERADEHRACSPLLVAGCRRASAGTAVHLSPISGSPAASRRASGHRASAGPLWTAAFPRRRRCVLAVAVAFGLAAGQLIG